MVEDKAHEHQAVLTDELMEGLNIDPGGFYIDATYGRGGHSRALLQRLNKHGRLFAFDKDPEACEHAQRYFGHDPRFQILQGAFTKMNELYGKGLSGEFKGIYFDLGVSSPQLNDYRRGFSFQHDGPLDMRMDPTTGITAAEWLARTDQKEIARIIRQYGEEPHAAKIASAIKSSHSLQTTRQLANLVASVVGPSTTTHPSTRTFLALRLYLNGELEDLPLALEFSLYLLKLGGRLAVISFHSLEDRIAKSFIHHASTPYRSLKRSPLPDDESKIFLKKIGKLIRPGKEEIERNPRARSARLRIAESIRPIKSAFKESKLSEILH